VWLVVVGLTILSFVLVEGSWLGPVSAAAVVAIAAVKSAMVIDHYMEARHAPARWRFLYKLWNFSAAAIIAIGQFMSVSPTV